MTLASNDIGTLIVGDLHCKQATVLPRVESLMRERGIARVIFLGDYADEWGTTADDVLEALSFQQVWLQEQSAAGRTVTLLVGNHDFEYLTGGICSGTHVEAAHEIRAKLMGLSLIAACAIDGFLVTHAGLTESWRQTYAPGCDDAAALAAVINLLFRSDDAKDLQALDECGPSRGGWGVPGPLWADRLDLLTDAALGISQIVGHTPVPTCAPLKGLADPVWFCDTLSLTRAQQPIGDSTALLIANATPEVVPLT